MTYILPPLPYAKDALEPYISKETLDYHYDKHHRSYVTKLNALLEKDPHPETSLEQLMKEYDSGPLFNNAAQIWNHTFYWHCLSEQHNQEPQGQLKKAIIESFGSFAQFKEDFSQAACNQFGSGWAWLVRDDYGKLYITSSSNADNPLKSKDKPILTCDVWEHAYYIDTRNNRATYLENFWKVVNWAFSLDQYRSH